MFIEMENTIEGLVRMSSMEDDYYNYDDRHFCLIGERTHKTYRIGDVVRVILAKADIYAKKIEFVLAETEEESELKKLNGIAGNDFVASRTKRTKTSLGKQHSTSNGDRASNKGRTSKGRTDRGRTSSDRKSSDKVNSARMSSDRVDSDTQYPVKKPAKKGKVIDKKVLDQITGKRKRKKKI
jgi:ribonuclease R